MDRRSFTTEFQVRAKPNGGAIVEGHGAVFNKMSRNLGGFIERVAPDAFTKTLADNPDVRALRNHEPSDILGRTRSGTLRLATDSTGLAYEIDMPDTTVARDLLISLERGDITQSSFGFFLVRGGDEWTQTEDGMPLRTLNAVSLHNGDVSPVTYPAYPDADSGLRVRAYRSFAERYGLELDTVLAAGEAGDLRALTTKSLSEEKEPPPEQAESHSDEKKAAPRSRAYLLRGPRN